MSLEDTNAGQTVGSAVADVSPNGAGNATPSIDDTLRSAYREHMARAEPGAEAGAGNEGAAAESAQGRQRGPDGRFQKGETSSAEPVAEPDTQPTQQAQPKPHDVAPNTWRKEIAADFGKLPESIREEIYRRENDFHKGIGQYREAAEFGTVMAQELLPYQQIMAQHNVNARDVIKSLAQSWHSLITGTPQQKAQLVLKLVQDYGIDFASLGTASQQSQTQPIQDDPRLAAALQRLDKIEGNLTAQERQRAEADYASHVDAVTKFGSDPKNEHFSAVREDMAALLNAGQAKDLQDAYDKAIWINPGVRASLLAKQDKERAEKYAAEAAAARKAAGANVTRRGTPPVPQKTGSKEDTIRNRYRELMGS